MGYPFAVPIGVPLYCSIWTSFWNILISYFIYLVVKTMKAGWSFFQRLDSCKASFLPCWHLKFTPEKPNSYITIILPKLQVPRCRTYRGKTFPHNYAFSENTPKIISIGPPIKEKWLLKKLKMLLFLVPFISKTEIVNIFYFPSLKCFGYYLSFWIFDIYQSTIVEIKLHQTCYFGSLDTAGNNLITDKGKQQ